jgi:hypothetical protein
MDIWLLEAMVNFNPATEQHSVRLLIPKIYFSFLSAVVIHVESIQQLHGLSASSPFLVQFPCILLPSLHLSLQEPFS